VLQASIDQGIFLKALSRNGIHARQLPDLGVPALPLIQVELTAVPSCPWRFSCCCSG
jgi:hypothetical protein